MNFVIDTNIFMSALIKDSVTRQIIMQSGWKFAYPVAALQEIEKYQQFIREKANISETDYQTLFSLVSSYVVFVPLESMQEYLQEAQKIMQDIDPKDVIFIATALSLEDEGIWSDDTHFDNQHRFKVWKTPAVLSMFHNMQNNIWKVLDI